MDQSQIERIKLFCERKYGITISDADAKEIGKNLIHLAKAITRYHQIQQEEGVK